LAFTPDNWNVVIIGAWNPAILTPAGIREHLFELPSTSSVEVLVPIDGIGPPLVRHGGTQVAVSSDSIILSAQELTVPGITSAIAVGIRAMDVLPRTPLLASGVNFRFAVQDLPTRFVEGMESSLDRSIAALEFHTQEHLLKRKLRYREGELNFEIALRENQSGTVAFNFNRTSTDRNDHRNWLANANAMHDVVEKFMEQVLGFRLGGAPDEDR
jgi:hypothetical protein